MCEQSLYKGMKSFGDQITHSRHPKSVGGKLDPQQDLRFTKTTLVIILMLLLTYFGYHSFLESNGIKV